MPARSINDLTKRWRSLTERIISFREVPADKVRLLLLETYTVLHALKQRRTVPKSMCELLCEMQNFAWWVNDLKCSPLHGLYPLFVTAIDKMKEEFISGETDAQSIAKFLSGELTAEK